jgi:hypothetical protein
VAWKLLLLISLLFAVQTYGVVGAWQAKRVTRDCTLEVGPLCYAWEPNALSTLISDEQEERVAEQIEKMRELWEDKVGDKLKGKKAPEIEQALKDAGDRLRESLEALKEKAGEAIDP